MSDDVEHGILAETGVARKICQGHGDRFGGAPCKYYDRLTWKCDLLDGRPISAVFEHGRCLSEKEVYLRAYYIARRFGPDYEDEFADLTLFIYGGLSESGKEVKGLLEQVVDEPRLDVLYSYVNRAIRSEMIRMLRKRGLMARKKECRNCIHWGTKESRVCQSQEYFDENKAKWVRNVFWGIKRDAHDQACGGYRAQRYFYDSYCDEDDDDSSEMGARMDRKNLVCADSERRERMEASIDVKKLLKALRACVRRASTAKKDMHVRRLEYVAYIYSNFRKGLSYKEGLKRLLDVRTSGNQERENYSSNLRDDRKAIEHCLSGLQPCR